MHLSMRMPAGRFALPDPADPVDVVPDGAALLAAAKVPEPPLEDKLAECVCAGICPNDELPTFPLACINA